ncbi:MAG: DUF3108 domain-containing protein [Cyclobacteriaceae bacterium]|nr:DUF3108 domain-containing protein [Cyclobacteriaceae bacterium]MCH8514932.1 DUF3108 domain-containing protein [Cyclobacteriaceae bacterium]
MALAYRFLFTLYIMIQPIVGVAQYNELIKEVPFKAGETFTYRVHFGVATAGEATISVEPKIKIDQGERCYEVNIRGRSTGLISKLYEIENLWGTYINDQNYYPTRFYRHIKENSYRRYETYYFDQQQYRVRMVRMDKENKEIVTDSLVYAKNKLYDMVSGFVHLRMLDYSKVKEGDIIKIPSFFDKEIYEFQVEFLGIETIKTKIGTFNAYVLSPIMPENKIFRGKTPIRVWVTTDASRMPVKCKASLVVGSVGLEIKDVEGLKYLHPELNLDQ